MNNMTTIINGVPATPQQEKEMEREAYFRQQNIKSLYAQLYEFGLKTEQVRTKLQKMSEFFGNIGSVSDLSGEQMGAIEQLLNYLKNIGYKF